MAALLVLTESKTNLFEIKDSQVPESVPSSELKIVVSLRLKN